MLADIMTIREVADYLKLTDKTAYRLAADGKTPCSSVIAENTRCRTFGLQKCVSVGYTL